MGTSSRILVCRLHLQLLQLDDMHPIRPVPSLTRAHVGTPLLHSAHQPEHDVVLLERELLSDFDTLNQFLYIDPAHKGWDALSTYGTYRRGPEEQRVIPLRAIEVCSPGVAREGFDTLLERQDGPNHLPHSVRVCQTNTLGFRNQEVFKQLSDSFESEP